MTAGPGEVVGTAAVDPAVGCIPISQVGVEREQHDRGKRTGERVDGDDRATAQHGPRKAGTVVPPPEPRTKGRAAGPKLEIGGVVDHSVTGQEEHGDDRRNEVEVTSGDGRQCDHHRQGKGSTRIVGRSCAHGERLEAREDAIFSKALQHSRGTEGRRKCRRQRRGEHAGEHCPTGQREITHDRRGVVDERACGCGAGEEDDHTEVDDGRQADCGERSSCDGAAGIPEIA